MAIRLPRVPHLPLLAQRLTQRCTRTLILAAALIGAMPGASAARSASLPHAGVLRRVIRQSGESVQYTNPPHLTYYGGPVISSVRVVMVQYGTGLDTTIVSKMPGFYQTVVQSNAMDWMCQYNTFGTDFLGRPGTQQPILKGAWVGSVAITPDPTRNGLTITDAQIQTELLAQFASHALPAPDSSMLYMIHFAAGKHISLDGTMLSCRDFCAYHSSFYTNGRPVRYAVIPDLGAGSGCDLGCGNETTVLDRTTHNAWHEMSEAITDPDVALATSDNAPLAWYDAGEIQPNFGQWGEIADICDFLQPNGATIVAPGGGTVYTVHSVWSNIANSCIFSSGACQTTSVDEAPIARIGLDLETANPARSGARFRVFLPQRADVHLAVYDVVGRRVADLVQGELDRGSHVAVWEPATQSASPAPGVYFARLRAGDATMTRTVIIAR